MSFNESSTMSPLEILELLLVRYNQVSFPQEFTKFLSEQEKQSHQIIRIKREEPLVNFFRRQEVLHEEYRQFFSEESFVVNTINYQKLLGLSPGKIFAYLLDSFGKLFDLQQIALDSEFPTGFNRHGKEHVSSVADTALLLLKDFDPFISEREPQVEKETIIGAFFHDIGNLIGRKYHGFYGAYLACLLFDNFSSDEALFNSFLNIIEIIMFHEVEFGSQLSMLASLNASTLSVIIADKTDVGVNRISLKSNVPEATEDVHVLLNLLVANSKAHRRHDFKHFRWTIDFQSKIETAQSELFSSLLKVTGRVKYPKEWQLVYVESNIEYLFVFNTTFLNVYLSRIYFALHAVFALYPSVSEFQFIIEDIERGVSLSRIFTRTNYLEKIFLLGKLFYKQDWHDNYLYEILHQFDPNLE